MTLFQIQILMTPKAQEAQLVEQKIEDFLVVGSIPTLGNLIDVLELENKLFLGRSGESLKSSNLFIYKPIQSFYSGIVL
jgi:hypothetical protein